MATITEVSLLGHLRSRGLHRCLWRSPTLTIRTNQLPGRVNYCPVRCLRVKSRRNLVQFFKPSPKSLTTHKAWVSE